MAEPLNGDAAGIIWLASYPKSGNTWMRAFLTNYLHHSPDPADINELEGGPIASSRPWFDDWVGVEASILTNEEILSLRPAVYRYSCLESRDVSFIKIHDAYIFTPEGEPIVPTDISRGVIYIVRNPLDVVISFSHHMDQSLAQTLAFMNNPEATMARALRGIHDQLPQKLLSWSQHVSSWVEQAEIPVHVVRYEEMLSDPSTTFASVLRFAGLPCDAENLERAIRYASFDVLKAQEQGKGFKERRSSSPFFRQGRSEQWNELLSANQIADICHAHMDMMQRFGYLPSQTDH